MPHHGLLQLTHEKSEHWLRGMLEAGSTCDNGVLPPLQKSAGAGANVADIASSGLGVHHATASHARLGKADDVVTLLCTGQEGGCPGDCVLTPLPLSQQMIAAMKLRCGNSGVERVGETGEG